MLLTTVTMLLNGSRKLILFVYLTFLILGLVSWQFLTLSTFPIFFPVGKYHPLLHFYEITFIKSICKQ